MKIEIGPKSATELIRELSLALDVCASCNRNGIQWAADSPFQEKIDDLLDKSVRQLIAAHLNAV